MRIRCAFLVALIASSVASMQNVGATAPGSHAHYVDANDYLTDEAAYEAWYTLRANLRHNFDDICGDTFCEGDYSNIQSLDYQCSVDLASGRLGECTWVFAASNEDIAPGTGQIDVTPATWACPTALVAGTTIEALLGALAGDEPLYATLPGSAATVYDGLIDCL